MKFVQPIFILPVAAVYFLISWLTPWHQLAPKSSISASYVFDLVFILMVFIFNQEINIKGFIKPKTLFLKAIVTTICAVICLSFIHYNQLQTPFKFVDNLFLQMIILAPFIEEFVFREAFYTLQKRFSGDGKSLLFLNSLLFSFSHYSGALLLPEEFHSFIYLQLAYTFPLGWLCAKSRKVSGGVIEPIILHLTFNTVFYIGVIKFGI